MSEDLVNHAVAGLAERLRVSKQREEEWRASLVADPIVQVLRELQRQLDLERQERQRLAAQVRQHEEELTRIRTGAPGRPGSSHLILNEFNRRADLGDVEETLKEQASALISWVREAHPEAAPIKQKTAENKIRSLYREHRLKRRPDSP